MSHLEPARTIIEKLGGPDAVARITERHVSRVYRWMYPRKRGGTDGFIPHVEARKLLDYAGANAIDLGPGDFFPPGAAAALECSSPANPANATP